MKKTSTIFVFILSLSFNIIAQTPYYMLYSEEQKIRLFEEANKLGEAANEFSVITMKQDTLNLEKLKGKIVFLNFFFAGCPPCFSEVPELNKILRKYQKYNFVGLGVSICDDKVALQDYQQLLKNKKREEWLFELCPAYDFEVFNRSFKSSNRKLANQIFITNSFPTNIIIDKEGIVRYRKMGYQLENIKNMENVLDSIIHDKYKLKEIATTATIFENLQQKQTYELKEFFFDSNSYEIMNKNLAEIDKLYNFLISNDRNIEIIAYTDDLGDEDNNLILSQKRADALSTYLINKGINQNRILAKGLGVANPKVPNINEKNMAINRRVEIILH